MTSKKDLKKRVHERQAKTGERYTTALAHVLAQRPEAPSSKTLEFHDVSEWARLEEFRCRAAVSGFLWDLDASDAGARPERFRRLFARLRSLLVSLRGEMGADSFSRQLFQAEPWEKTPNAIHELFEARRFTEQVRSGVRGVSRNGRLVAFDVPDDDGAHVTLIGVLQGAPRGSEREPLLWIKPFGEHEALDDEISAEMANQLLLAGLGGLRKGGR
jgi:hypothetical protein